MAILFGTSRNRFPDFFSGTTTSADQLFNVAQDVLGKALTIAGARVFNGSFVEDGVQSVNGSAFINSKFSDLVEPSRRQFFTQAPQATVFIKKRMFSTLRSNYDVRFLDADERLQLRAVKNLFRRKCEEIAFYENLVNIKKIIADPSFLTTDGLLDQFLQVLGLSTETADIIGGAVGALVDSFSSTFPWLADIRRLQKINDRAKQYEYTSWIMDPDQPNFSGTGPGVGVMELTIITNIDTVVSLRTGEGSCNLTIEDPYQLTLITESDVDFALRQARAEEGGMAGFLDVTAQNNLRDAAQLDQDLNTRLRNRNFGTINFEFPLGANSDVIASIVETNQPFGLGDLDTLGFDTFEQALILQIFDLLQSYKTLQSRTSGILLESTAQASQVRQKLRSEFVGHHIIQQMDAVSVFMNSFTRNETPIYANRADLLLSKLGEAIVTPEEQQGRMSDEALDQERQVLAPNLALSIYKLLRNPVEWRATGPQVFSGLITTISPSYDAGAGGRFRLQVSAKDNMEFLSLSQINTQPSLEQSEGTLMDPLTPFDIITDETSGLVIDKRLSDINQQRLKFLKLDNGTPITSENDLITDTGRTSTVFTYQHVPGLVYKWKTGIISASLNVSIAKPLARGTDSFTIEDVSEDFGLHLIERTFANLDAADILAILITGQPYNYNNFIKNALDAGTFSIDNDTNNRSYFNFLFDYLDRQQNVWGGFIPAKSSSIDPEKTADAFRQQRAFTRTITKLTDLRRDLARQQDAQRKAAIAGESGADIKSRIDELSNSISSQLKQLDSGDALTDQSPFKFFGNAVQVHFSPEDHQALKNEMKYIVRKKPEEVRFNQDKNYFIVSDKYDTDLDIQAFVLQLKNSAPDLFSSDWKKPIDICKNVATMLDFEFFADSQGNIVFRPPEYNKTPLSLLLQMVQLGRGDGISLAPPFLLHLVSNRVELMRQKLLTIELDILEKGKLLGFGITDIAVSFGVKLALSGLDSGEYALDEAAIIDERNKSRVFTEDEQQKVVFDFKRSETTPLSTDFVIQQIIDIRNQLASLRGSTQGRLVNDSDTSAQIQAELNKYDPATVGSFTARLTLANSIAQLVSQRQTLIPLFNKLVTEATQINAADAGLNLNSWNVIPEALGNFIDGAPGDNPILPKFLEDLIENDYANFDGFNSGKRFVINDDVVLSMNLTIQAPEFTRVDVTGNQNLVDFSSVLGKSIGEGSNMFWAGATDFDMWRQYGYRGTAGGNNNKAFLQNAETQCAPYAVFQLVRQRRQIHRGTITVIGNEHYQVGDVVYVNNRQMMYYVESVQQSLDISHGTFRTTLSLTYGRPLGEYIPTPLDIIGKGLLANVSRPFSAIKTVRSLTGSGAIVNLDTLVIPTDQSQASQSNFEDMNSKRIQNAIQRALGRITADNKKNFSIEIRSYFASDAPINADTSGSFGPQATARDNVFFSSSFYAGEAKKLLVRGTTGSKKGSFSGNAISADKIKIVAPIDISKPLQGDDFRLRRMPSEQAWANALDVAHGGFGGLPTNSIDIVMVIDRAKNPDAASQSDQQDEAMVAASAANPPIPADANPFADASIATDQEVA